MSKQTPLTKSRIALMHISHDRSLAMGLSCGSQAQEVLSSQAKVVGGIEVGGDGIMAMRTMEMKPITDTFCSASRANLRAIGGVNQNYGDTRFPSLVADEVLQSGESPGVVRTPLPFPHLRSFPNVSEVFHCDCRRPFHCLLDHPFAYVVEHPRQDTVFSPANGSDAPPSGASALCLKLLSYLIIMPSDMLGLLALEIKTCGQCSKVSPPHINADGLLWLNLLNLFLYDQTKIDLAIVHIQHNLGLTMPPIKILLVIFGDNDREIKPAPNDGYGCLVLFYLEGGTVKVVGVAVELNELPSSQLMLVCPTHLPYDFAHQPRWERAGFPHWVISSVVETISAVCFRTEGDSGCLIEGLVIGLESAVKDSPAFGSCDELELQGFPNKHRAIITQFTQPNKEERE